MSRGVLYVVWGNYNRAELKRSIDSVKAQGYDYHVAEIEDEGIGLAHKSKMYDLTPFDTTLFLDTDTEVLGDLGWGFLNAEIYDVCCCIAPASSAYLAAKEIDMPVQTDLPQYNTGVIFFNNRDLTKDIFDMWKGLCESYPLSSKNDQVAFSASVFCPYVLPRTWNYRAKVRYEAKVTHGPIKIIHAR